MTPFLNCSSTSSTSVRSVSTSSSVTREYMRHLQLLLLDDDAVEHADDPVGLAPHGDVVGDDEEDAPPLDVQPAHQRDDLLRVLGVEVAGRLVRPDDRGVVDERAGDRDPLGLRAPNAVPALRRPGRVPPESASGTCPARSATPTSSSASSAFCLAGFAPTRARRSGSSTFSTA